MQGQALPGFRDFYPDELALKNHIFATWREVARRYGFQEYDGPPLEPLELYTDKSGEEIVQQLYAFEDKGGRKVALRPEMTPTLARMVGAHAQALKKPIRWFSIPQLFRYERQQRGRLREHFQLNMDILGEASPLADAELIAAAIDIMRAFGFGPADVQARVSDRRVLRTLLLGRGLTEAQLPTAFEVIDKSERVPQEALAEILAKVGIARREASIVFEVANLRSIETVTAALAKVEGGEEAGEPLRQAVGALEAMGLGDFVAVDLTIVRGLAYYTGIVFELFDTGKSLRAICGGGRYDGLLKALGGVDLPALGFGMGDVEPEGGKIDPAQRLQQAVIAAAPADRPQRFPSVEQLEHDPRVVGEPPDDREIYRDEVPEPHGFQGAHGLAQRLTRLLSASDLGESSGHGLDAPQIRYFEDDARFPPRDSHLRQDLREGFLRHPLAFVDHLEGCGQLSLSKAPAEQQCSEYPAVRDPRLDVRRPEPERPHDVDRGGDQLRVGERARLAEDVHIELKVLPQPSALLSLVAKQLRDREPANRLFKRLGVRSHHAGEGGRHLGTQRDLTPALVLERVQLLHDLRTALVHI